MDEALRIAQKLELWKKDSERRLGEGKKSKLTKDDWKMREVTGEEPKVKSLARLRHWSDGIETRPRSSKKRLRPSRDRDVRDYNHGNKKAQLLLTAH